MGEGHDGGVRVGQQRAHHVVGHAQDALHAIHMQAGRVFLARVTHQHIKIQQSGNLRHRLRQLARADQHKPPLRTENRLQNRAVIHQRLAALRPGQRHRAAGHLQAAGDQLMLAGTLQNAFDPASIAQGFVHQTQGAAAGQAKARGLFLANAVHDFARQSGRCAAGHGRGGQRAKSGFGAGDQVLFHAAARDRAANPPVVADREQCAGRARGAAPGLHHGDQGEGMAGAVPGQCIGKHPQIQAVHGALNF